MAKMGWFRAPRRGWAAMGGVSEGASERAPQLRAPERIYRVIIVILVIDYPRTISAALWLCIYPPAYRVYVI